MSFLAIFDVDGTLVDSQHHITAAMDHAHDATGRPRLPRETVLEIVGLSLPEAFRHLHPGLGAAEIEALIDGYRGAFGGLPTGGKPGPQDAAPLYAGARETLARLTARSGMQLGTATGKGRRGLNAMIEVHEMQGWFATLQCADGHPSKPNPSMVLGALGETGIAPGRAVMIGDTEYDIAMGRAAGVTTIGVTWGYHAPDRLRGAGAHHLVGDWAALEHLLGALSQ